VSRHRLDAGSFGTMGVGLGFAIAAALHAKDQVRIERETISMMNPKNHLFNFPQVSKTKGCLH